MFIWFWLFIQYVFAQPLPILNINQNAITVSGISAGCYMAVQTHIAHSSLIKGLACTAGGPYWCAQNNVDIALTQCMQKESAPQINLDYLQQIMENTAAFGYIDPLENLKYARLWFYSAQNDTVVDPLVVQKNMDLYSRFTEEKQILSIFTNPGEHSQPTLTYGNPCDFLGTPFINNCAFDAAGSQLQHLYGPLNPPTKNTSGILFEFDQSTYIPLLPPLPPFTETGLAKTAYMYIPQQCTTTKSDPCALHITFHGCEQTTQDIGLSYIKHAGYIEWADTNGIVILFPQATATLTNPKGCFDWWGYTGADYASNLGIQIQTVYAMIKAIII